MKTLFTFLLISTVMIASAQSTVSGSFIYAGASRAYQLYVPAAYSPGTPVPVVLNLHGYGSNNTQQMAYANFKPIADTANFLIIAPQGLPDPINSTAHWNANWGTGIDDIGFINALLDTISAHYSVNQDRIYSTGMSNGGFMSLTLAGQLDNRIAAVASVTGTMSIIQIPANTVSRPVPVMQIHGDADATVPYNGDASFLSVDSVINYWVGHNNCNTTPVFTSIANTNTSDGCTAEKYEYLGGDNGSEVVHYKILGGAHTWPGAAFTIGVTNRDFNACIEIWKFFSRYEKSTLVSAAAINKASEWVKISSENPTNGIINLQSLQNELFTAQVYDINGKMISSSSIPSSNLKLDITNSSTGLYFVHVIGSSKSTVFKLVKN